MTESENIQNDKINLDELDKIMLQGEAPARMQYDVKVRFDEDTTGELLRKVTVLDKKNEKFDAAIQFAKNNLSAYDTKDTSLFIRSDMRAHFSLSVDACDTILEVLNRERTKAGFPTATKVKTGDADEYDMDSESGRAKIVNVMAANYMKNRHIVCLNDKLLVYKEGIYEVTDEAEALAKQVVLELLEQVGVFPTSRLIKGALDIVKIKTVKSIKECEPNVKNIIVLNNGTYDLESWEFTPFNEDSHKNVYFTKIPVSYNPNAKNPEKFLGFMEKCFAGNPIDKLVAQELFGYCLTRNYKHQCHFSLVGDGGNGKGTFTSVLEDLVGISNVSHNSMFQISDHQNSDYFIAKMLGKFINISGDESKRTIVNTENVKKLTSNTDVVTGRNVREKPIEFLNFAKLLFLENQVPKQDDATFGDKRRLQIISFENRISNNTEEIKDFHTVIINSGEMEGVLLWALEGLKRLEAQNDFSDTRSVAQKHLDFKKRSDPMIYFLDECLEEDVDAITPSVSVYAEYERFRKTIKGPELGEDKIKDGVIKACKESGWDRVHFKRETIGKNNRYKFPEIYRDMKKIACFTGIKISENEPQKEIEAFVSPLSGIEYISQDGVNVIKALKENLANGT